MLSYERWAGSHDLRKLSLQRRGDLGVQLLTPVAQQRAVGGILHKRVLEGILRIRRRPAPEDQFGFYELFQCFGQFLRRHSSGSANEFIRERTPERCPDLGYLACRSEAIKPRQERCMERCRDRQRAVGPVMA